MNSSPPASQAWVQEAVTQYERLLLAYAWKMLGDFHRARDVVQDTFLRLCNQPREEVEPELKAWLYTVCRNRCLDIFRKENRMHPLDEPGLAGQACPEPNPALAAERKESHRQLIQILETLPHNQREVVRLKFLHDLSYREISKVTSLTEGNVGFLIHTALKTLRQRLIAQAATEPAL